MQLSSLKDTKSLSKKISKIIKTGDVIFLYGEIGTGKTTFVRFFINHLEVENGIKKSDILSPTFNIVYDYEIGKVKVYHYDLYRLKNVKELYELDMFENFKNNISIIEWPEILINELKKENYYYIKFSFVNNITREIKLNHNNKSIIL